MRSTPLVPENAPILLESFHKALIGKLREAEQNERLLQKVDCNLAMVLAIFDG
jgi:hypothetical protein